MLDQSQSHPGTGPIAGLGAIDCDVHPRLPVRDDLMPYFDAYWRDQVPYRNIDRLELTGHPVSLKPYRRGDAPDGNADAAALAASLLDPNGLSAAILTLSHGTQALYDPYMADAFCQATNRWLAADWLDRDPRLRAALLVPFQHPEAAAEEIRRYADDKRFVAVTALAMGERPLGQRVNWPIYKAAAEAGFALQILPGSVYRQAPSQAGYPSFLVEERVHTAQAAASQAMSLLSEGVMTEYPDMKVVMAGTGASWLFGMSWRVAKDWRGARVETPWIRESPEKILERQLRLTIAPLDAPPDPDDGQTLVECIGSADMLLYASDFPHAHAGPAGAWPRALPQDLAPAIARTNPAETYPRLEV